MTSSGVTSHTSSFHAAPMPSQAPARRHVQGGDGLGQDAGIAAHGAGNQSQQPGSRRGSGQGAQRGVRLEHLVVRWTEHPDLEEVVHHREELEPGVIGGIG
jgi:hypothetical protein